MPKCTGVILSHDEVLQKPFLESSPWLQSRCHLRWGRKCTSWVFQIDAILKKALRDRRSQTIGSSQVHMAITLTITMVCRHNISFLQNSSHHCHPIDFPWKCWKRCWLLGGRLATEPTGSSLQTAAGWDAHWLRLSTQLQRLLTTKNTPGISEILPDHWKYYYRTEGSHLIRSQLTQLELRLFEL